MDQLGVMLPRVGTMFSMFRRSGNKRTPSTTASPAEPNDAPPRAIHASEMTEPFQRLPTATRPHPAGYQSLSILVVDPKGVSNYFQWLYSLLERDKGFGLGGAGGQLHLGECDTVFLCNDYHYTVDLIPTTYVPAHLALLQHICLLLPYNASSRASWDDITARYERMRDQCPDQARLPFLATMIASVADDTNGPQAVSHEEAAAWASERGCRFVTISPSTGRGIGDALGSLVELAYAARRQFPSTPPGPHARPSLPPVEEEKLKGRLRERGYAIHALFAK